MEPGEIDVVLSIPMIVGLALAGLLPLILWAVTITRMMKELLEMHRNPESSAAVLAQQEVVRDLHESTVEIHFNQTRVIEGNTLAINQLSHFVQWFAKKSTGETAPPYVGKAS